MEGAQTRRDISTVVVKTVDMVGVIIVYQYHKL